ncbi:MAG: hypothetical protein IKA36_04455 [Clostridia bacterium]|nr:hypothetical protein [Clostridia bacterium]
MKKFTRILVCLMLFVFAFSFVACGNKDKDKFVYPSSNMTTQGNGGMSVQKGNYLYFVNGFKSITSTDINKKTKYNIGSLNVTKLDEKGNPVTDDGGIKDDEYRTITDKLVGYEIADLYICGDYIYFASPCLENENQDGDQVWAKDKVVFYKKKLNNKGKVEKIYQSKVDYEELNYTYFNKGNNAYLLIHEINNDKIVCIDCSNSKVSETTQISSIAFPQNKENVADVFYIKNSTLYKYNVATNASTEYCLVDSTAELKYVGGDYVYIIESHNNGSNKDLLVSKISDKSEFEFICASSSYKDVKISADGKVVVCLDDKFAEYYIVNIGQDMSPEVLTEEESSIKIIGFNTRDLFYYIESEDSIIIKSVSMNNILAGSESEVVEVATISGLDKNYFDIEDDYIYFYKNAGNGSNLYLHRISVNNPDSTQSAQMIGMFIDSDIKTEE